MQLGVLIVFVAIVLLSYPSSALVDQAGSQSRSVYRFFVFSLLATMLLVVPAFPATSIVREKISGSLALLLNSPMSPWAIYFGKFAGIAFFLLILLSLTFPALATCYSMGGVSMIQEILPLYAIVLITGMLLISLGLLVSTFSQSTDTALRVTYFAAFSISIATLLPWIFLQGKTSTIAQLANYLRYMSPITATTQLLGMSEIGSQANFQSELGPWVYVFVALSVTVVLILINVFMFAQRIFDFSRSEGLVTDERSLAVRTSRRLFFIVDPDRRKKGIGTFTNPVFVKEFRTRRFGRSHWLLRFLFGCVVVSVGLTYLAATSSQQWGIDAISGIVVLLQIAIVLLIAPGLASGLISSEIESGGWNLLLLTPMRPTTIVIGKLLSVFWIVFLILVSTLPGYLVLIWIQPHKEPQVYRVVITLLLASGFVISLCAMISSFFRRSATSTAIAYGLCTSVFVGTLLVWLGRTTTFGYSAVRRALLLNPISGALESFEADGFTIYQLLPWNWWITGIATLCFLIIFLIRTSLLMKPR